MYLIERVLIYTSLEPHHGCTLRHMFQVRENPLFIFQKQNNTLTGRSAGLLAYLEQ